jgi:hypothetical protein
LWASVCTIGHLPLAEVLLEAGANPTDGVTAHIAGGGGNLDALELLHRYGLNVNGIPGGVPPLVYMMLWADSPAGPYWLLDHGADANLAWGQDGEAPLHVAARRWDVAMADASPNTVPMCRDGARTAQRRTPWRSFLATRKSPRGCSRTAPSTSCRRSNGSSRRVRALMVPRPKQSCRLTLACDPSSGPNTS